MLSDEDDLEDQPNKESMMLGMVDEDDFEDEWNAHKPMLGIADASRSRKRKQVCVLCVSEQQNVTVWCGANWKI